MTGIINICSGKPEKLADYDVDDSWEFKCGLEEKTGEKWTIRKCITNHYHGNKLKVICRYILYFLFSFKIFIQRNKFEKIIAWQQFYGLLLVFFCRLFKVKKIPSIYIMTFIYKPKNAVYEKLMRFIVQSDYYTKIIVLSDEEKNYYSKIFNIDKDRFCCTRIGVPDISNRINKKRKEEKYYLSVGRSNRDYSFLREAWKKEYGKLIIICDSYLLPEKDGIVCLKNCYGDEYLEYVAGCYAQFIPLEDKNISSGSLTFLQAMMLSKLSIVTENDTVTDYITSGKNGIIIEKQESSLREALQKLENIEFYNSMCEDARVTYLNFFSERSLGINVATIINS